MRPAPSEGIRRFCVPSASPSGPLDPQLFRGRKPRSTSHAADFNGRFVPNKAPTRRPPRDCRSRPSGLVLRVTANCARTFAFRFRHPLSRKTLRLTIGGYPAVNLEAARKRAREMAAQVGAGESPIDVRMAEREATPTRTFAALAERYLREYAERFKRPRSIEEDRRNLAVHVLPKWGKRDFRTIRRADIIALIESIISDGKHAAANRVHTLISGIFSFAIDAELLDANPAARLRKRGVEQPRHRVLDDGEIRTFWNKIVLSPVSRPVGLALRLALLTAARANEVAGARKAEFQNLNGAEPAVWVIPGERVKNKRDHLLPLAPLAVTTIKTAIGLTDPDDEFLFPTPLGRGGPIDRHTLSMAMARFGKSLKGQGAAAWQKDMPTPHDLRRSAATRLAEMGIPKEIRDRVLNHAGDRHDPESKHYNKYDFQKEKCDALSRWAAQIAAIVEPAKVVSMPVKRRR
jgi:integrase